MTPTATPALRHPFRAATVVLLSVLAMACGTVATTSWWLGHASLDPDRFAHAMTDTLALPEVRAAAGRDARRLVDTTIDDLGIPVGASIRGAVAQRLAATATGPNAANLWRYILAKTHRLAFESTPNQQWGISGAEVWWVLRPALVDAAPVLDDVLPDAREPVGATDSVSVVPADLLPPIGWLGDAVDALRNLPWIAGLAAGAAAAGAIALSRRRVRLLVILAGGLICGMVVPAAVAALLPGAMAGIGLPGETLPMLVSGTASRLLAGWWHASLVNFILATGCAAAAFGLHAAAHRMRTADDAEMAAPPPHQGATTAASAVAAGDGRTLAA